MQRRTFKKNTIACPLISGFVLTILLLLLRTYLMTELGALNSYEFLITILAGMATGENTRIALASFLSSHRQNSAETTPSLNKRDEPF